MKYFSHFLILFKYSCLYLTPPYPSHPHSPSLILPLFGFVHVPFIDVPENPPPFPPIIPSHFPSGYCQFVLNFSDFLINK